MRRSLRNRLLTRSHAAFDSAVGLAKRIVRR
jgi:hypothetical protein